MCASIKTVLPVLTKHACGSNGAPGPSMQHQHLEPDAQCTCCPVGRSGHRILVNTDCLYSLGGFNPSSSPEWDQDHLLFEPDGRGLPLFKELWKFNFSTQKWNLLDGFNSVPPTIASHTIAKEGRWLFLFGGTSIPFGETPTSAIYRYDLKSTNFGPDVVRLEEGHDNEMIIRRVCNRWHLLPVEGDIPQERYGHTMTMRYPDIYIVGGTTGYIYNSEVYHLDLRQPVGRWTKLSSDFDDPKQPVGRYRHETAFDGKKLYIFGGGTDRDAFSLVNIHTFDVETCYWSTCNSVPDPQHGHPAPRKCHSCCQSGNDVYLLGGISGTSANHETKMFDDIWKFSLVDATWKKYSTTLHVPLYFHSADICEKSGCIWIFGGVTGNHTVRSRTNRLMCLRVKVGTLQELSWSIVCNLLCNEWSQLDLDELGIPANFQRRLRDS